MKKKLYLIFILLLIPMKVFAGGYYEETTIYKAKISNQNGAKIYDCSGIIDTNDCTTQDKVLQYNKEIIITSETERNGTHYVAVLSDENISESGFKTIKDMYNLPYGKIEPLYIKYEDISLTNVNLNDYKKIEVEFYPIDNSNYLYKGPSTKYGKIDSNYSLEPNKLVKSQYYVGRWYYVTQNNNSGWIFAGEANSYNVHLHYGYWSENKSTLAEKFELKVLTISASNDINLYDSPITKKVIKTIPQNTELNTLYKYETGYDEKVNYNRIYFYVKYKDTYGWIESHENIAYDDKNEILINTSELEIYSTIITKDSDIFVKYPIETLKEKQIVKSLYNYNNQALYIKTEKEAGWLLLKDYEDYILFKCNEKTDEDKCINNGEKYTYYTRNYDIPFYYFSNVEFNINSYEKVKYYNANEEMIESIEAIDTKENEIDESQEIIPEKPQEEINIVSNNNNINKNLIAIIMSSIVLIALIITLIIISKKKKSK